MKIVAIIQARMGSTRLPGKVMKDLFGKTVLAHIIERVIQSKEIDDVVIATTLSEQDELIVNEAKKYCVNFFRGSEDDVLSRYYFAAKKNDANIIVRLTADCPLIDPKIIDNVIKYFKENDCDLATNAGIDLSNRTYPRGLDTEVFKFEILEEAYINANEPYQREHVTPYIYENSRKICICKNKIDYSHYRWTLDTEEDFQFIKQIYKYLYKGEHNFYMDDIIRVINDYPYIKKINEKIMQKSIKG